MKVSVIVCTYSRDLFGDTMHCIYSIMEQDYPEIEIILVMDTNVELLKMYQEALTDAVRILVNEVPGLSQARNLGIRHATGDVIVFVDDDAIADKHYLTNLMKNYADAEVIGVGGKILPMEKPAYPEELYWIGGFTYRGYPKERCPVRNVLGCNMSFRREVFIRAGLFNVSFGRIGRKLVTAEETEFCLRAGKCFPAGMIVFDPSAVIYHKNHRYRQGLRYAVRRGYFEGLSKARIRQLNEGGNSIQTENEYLRYLVSVSIPGRFANILNTPLQCIQDIVWIALVIFSVGMGYLVGNLELERTAHSAN